VDFQDEVSWEHNMSAIWQDEHWFNCSAMLKDDGISRDMTGAVKVALLSLNHHLQLKARWRQLPAASEKNLAIILATGT
jgi:protein SMG6